MLNFPLTVFPGAVRHSPSLREVFAGSISICFMLMNQPGAAVSSASPAAVSFCGVLKSCGAESVNRFSAERVRAVSMTAVENRLFIVELLSVLIFWEKNLSGFDQG